MSRNTQIFPFHNRLSWRSAKIAVGLALLVGTIFAIFQVVSDIRNEKLRIQIFSNETLTSIQEQATRAVYRLDTTVAQDITNGLLSFSGVKEARLIDDFGDALAISKRELNTLEFGYIDRLLGTVIVSTKKELLINQDQLVGFLELDILPAAFSPGFSERTYGVLLYGFFKGAILSILLTLSFHSLISRRILDASNKFINNSDNALLSSKSNDEVDLLISNIKNWKEQIETSQKLANRNHDWFQLAAKSAGLGFWEWDPKSGKLIWDENMFEIYEINPENFSGSYSDWSNTLHPDDLKETEEKFTAFLEHSVPFNTEFRIITHKNKFKNITVDAVIIKNEQGNIETVVGINRDITERKKLETDLLKSRHFEALGKLTGAIAHDINNSLQIISNNAEYLQKIHLEPDAQLKHLFAIDRASNRSSHIINVLLAYARKQTLQKQKVEINSFILSMNEEIERILGNKINYYFFGELERIYINVDKCYLHESILNLVINAKEAIVTNGTIEIKVIRSSSAQEHLNNKIDIIIKDNGCGIDEEKLDFVFDPFYTTKKFGENKGLGLSQVYGFVKQSDGDITIENNIGKGVTFKITFPLDEEHLNRSINHKALKKVI